MTTLKQNTKTPFNKDFCTQLEYRICYEFEKSTDSELKGFWCDGISWTPNEFQLTKKYINDDRKIITKAWIGKTGQDEYQAIIYFGKKALSRFTKESDLTDSIPEIESQINWIEIDIKNKIINIRLD